MGAPPILTVNFSAGPVSLSPIIRSVTIAGGRTAVGQNAFIVIEGTNLAPVPTRGSPYKR
jgi:hypothetical protein